MIPRRLSSLLGLTLVLTLAQTSLAADPPTFTKVFVAAADGFQYVRIPSLIVSKAGTLLAFAEGRHEKAGGDDQAQNKIILRTSTDNGQTWSASRIIVDDGRRSLNNPCSVVDSRTGRIFLMVQSYPYNIAEFSDQLLPGYEGEAIVRTYLVTSDDDGKTWSAPRDLTRQIKRPDKANTLSSGPGIGIQLTKGPHAGRLVMPFNEGPPFQWNNFMAYSDDGGQTWLRGETVPGNLVPDAARGTLSLLNECQVVELSNGDLRLNSRRWAGNRVRKTSLSHDGGITWSPVEDIPEIVDSSLMASVIKYPIPDQTTLLYSGTGVHAREDGTIFISRDDGKTWPQKKQFTTGHFAYSVLTILPDGTIGCIFETDGHRSISYAHLTWDWLTTNDLK